MTLDEYLRGGRGLTASELCEAIRAKSVAQIRQWQHGYAGRMPGPAYCVGIEAATAGAVCRWDVRPHDWHLIWPELISAPGAPPVPAAPTGEAA